MNLLAIDTALEACSIGIAAGDRPAVLRSEVIGRGHAERLFPLLEAAIREAGIGYGDIGRIAVTIGPGSFTGVRVGIAAARGLALVLGCPVAGIGTLALIAEEVRAIAGALPVLAVLDARRGEVYAQAFGPDGVPSAPPEAGPPERFAPLAEGAVLAGSGAGLVTASVEGGAGRVVPVGAALDIRALVRLGLAAPESSGPPRPVYLRAPDAKPQAVQVAFRQ